MAKTSNHFILILCGGTGPRLWPLSRASYPKQFLKLFGKYSLLQDTIARFSKFIPHNNIFVISNHKYQGILKKQIGSSIPRKNIIIEPEKKNTTMAIIYGTAVIKSISPDAIITVAPSDHFISKTVNFEKDIKHARDIASDTDTVVTIGVTPSYPNPAYGYILSDNKSTKIRHVQKFIEKPTPIDAQILIKKNAQWNSGIYTFSSKSLSEQLARYQKDFHVLFQKLCSSPIRNHIVSKLYKLANNTPFDVAISELSSQLSVINATFTWSDIGEWQSIYNQLTKDSNGISKIDKTCLHVSFKSKNCLLSGNHHKLIGLVGVNNLAVIDTPNSLLVCNLNDSFSVRNLVSLIVADNKLKKFFLSDK